MDPEPIVPGVLTCIEGDAICLPWPRRPDSLYGIMTPLFYSFRRCPYAMRARLALVSSQVPVALREVVLRDKPAAFLAASPSGTVPCLVTSDRVIDESLDIMIWALEQNDPEGWLRMPADGWDWIARCDGPFKEALDKTKYATRYPESDPAEARANAAGFLTDLDRRLETWMFETPSVADFAILPFVRQFAFIDMNWFKAQDWPALQRWLAGFLASKGFAAIMPKFPQWQPGAPEVAFPSPEPFASVLR